MLTYAWHFLYQPSNDGHLCWSIFWILWIVLLETGRGNVSSRQSRLATYSGVELLNHGSLCAVIHSGCKNVHAYSEMFSPHLFCLWDSSISAGERCSDTPLWFGFSHPHQLLVLSIVSYICATCVRLFWELYLKSLIHFLTGLLNFCFCFRALTSLINQEYQFTLR